MGISTVQNNFTGGQISKSMNARFNLEKYQTSVRWMENFIPELHGPVTRRMGSKFLEDLGSHAVLIPFEFSSDPTQNFVVVVQEESIRIANKNGFVRDSGGTVLSLTSPYLEEQLYDISFTQSADVIYMAHPGHPLRKLVRYSNTDWRLELVQFTTSLPAPATVNVGFSGTGNGFILQYKVVAVDADGRYSNARIGQSTNAKVPSQWVVGEYADIAWSAVAGATAYNIYRNQSGTYGYIGSSTTTTFRDVPYEPILTNTPREIYNPFTQGNYPSVVTFAQQRLVLAAPALEPQKWYASRTGFYEDFSKSDPIQDDDMIEAQAASGRMDAIQWAASFGTLLFGTTGNEYRVTSGNQGILTATDINMREQSAWGSMKLRPLIIGNEILHAQRLGSYVRTLSYSLESDGYQGANLSILADDLLGDVRHSIVQWEYQQFPYSGVWCVRRDGVILHLIYQKDHDIYGWSQITTNGDFTSIACISGEQQDDCYIVVKRTINNEEKYYLEYVMPKWNNDYDSIVDAFYVDCGLQFKFDIPSTNITGLSHLEGMPVDVLADGSPHGTPLTVQNGEITLDYEASNVIVGLNYVSWICPNNPDAAGDDNTSFGRQRTYAGSSVVRLVDTVGGFANHEKDVSTAYPIQFIPEYYDSPIEPYNGDRQINPDTAGGTMPEVWLLQPQPLPMTISALRLDLEIHG